MAARKTPPKPAAAPKAAGAPQLFVRLAFRDSEPMLIPLAEYLRKVEAAHAATASFLKRELVSAERRAELRRLQLEMAECDRQIERLRKAERLERARLTRQTKNAARNNAIAADELRFARAFKSYEREGLRPLFKEFAVPPQKQTSFKPSNVATYLGKKHGLTATQVRTILKLAKVS